jgi:hypothetical protein
VVLRISRTPCLAGSAVVTMATRVVITSVGSLTVDVLTVLARPIEPGRSAPICVGVGSGFRSLGAVVVVPVGVGGSVVVVPSGVVTLVPARVMASVVLLRPVGARAREHTQVSERRAASSVQCVDISEQYRRDVFLAASNVEVH